MDWDVVKPELEKKLDPAHVKDPPKGKYGKYIEGWHVIAEANRIFGYDGWSYDVAELRTTNASRDGDMHRVGYMAVARVSVDSVTRTDVGHGQGFSRSEGDAHDSAVKEAVTDALKRALRTFGNQFGLALYDKSHANVGVDVPQAVMDAVRGAETLEALQKVWTANRDHQSDPDFLSAKDKRKAELSEGNAA